MRSDIQVVMTLDDGDLSIKTVKNGQVINDMKRSMDDAAVSTKALEGHSVSMGRQFERMVFTLSLVRFALSDIHDIFLALPISILKTAGEMERLTALMAGLSKETGDAAKQAEALSNRKFIFDMALNTPFEVKALSDAFVKFKSAGLDPTDGSLKGLVESVAKFGGSTDVMHRASIAIQQMAGKGVISMEELRQQLGEAVPNAITTLASAAGMSMMKLTQEIKKGTVEARSAIKLMTTAMQIDNAGSSAAMMDTWVGMLARIETKWEIFKNDIAQSGFFDKAKEQVSQMTEAFDSMGVKNMASNIGSSLAAIIGEIRSVVDLTVKWGGEIKIAGEIMLALFAINKIKSIGKAMEDMYKNSSINTSLKDLESANRRKIESINDVILASKKELAQREIDIAQETIAIREANQSQIASEKMKLEALRLGAAEQAGALVELVKKRSELNAQMSAQDIGSESGRARVSILKEQIATTEQAIVSGNKMASSIATGAEAINIEIAALERRKIALAQSTVANTEGIRAMQGLQTSLRENISNLEATAVATAKVELGTRLMHVTVSAGKMVWAAFGGWVGVAITVLMELGSMLYSYINRWKEFDEIVKKTKQGIASEDSVKQGNKRADELDAKIKEKQKLLDNMKGDSTLVIQADPREAAKVVTRTDTVAEIKALTEQYREVLANVSEQKNIIAQEAVDRNSTQAKRQYERESVAVMKAFTEENAKLEKDKLEAIRAVADKNGGSISAATDKSINDSFNAKINENRKKAANAGLKYVEDQIKDVEEQLKATSLSTAKKSELQAKLKVLNAGDSGLLDEYRTLAKNANELLGKGLSTVSKPENQKTEDPIIRMVETAKGNVAAAKLKLQSVISEERDLAELRKESLANVLGSMAGDKFDKSVGKNDDGSVNRNYMGGVDKRKEYVKQFTDYLASGKTDIDGFVNSLDALTEKEKLHVLELVNLKAEEVQLPALQKAVNDAMSRSAQARVSLNESRSRYEDQIGSKMDTAFLKEERHFAKEEAGLGGLIKDFEAYNIAKSRALTSVAMVEIYDNARAASEALRQADVQYNAMWQTAAEQRKAKYEEEIRLINQKYETEVANLMKSANLGKETDDETNRRKDALAVAQEAREKSIATAQKKDSISAETSMQKLERKWDDSTSQMNSATAKWGQSIVDNIVTATTAGKANWSAMALSFVTDVYKISLEKMLAKPLSTMMDSISSTIGGLLDGVTGAASKAVPGAIAGTGVADAAGGAVASAAADALPTAAMDITAAAPVDALAAAATSAATAIGTMTAAITADATATQADTLATEMGTTVEAADTMATEMGTAVEAADTAAAVAGTAAEGTDTAANVSATVAANALAGAMTAAAAASTAKSMFANGGIMTSAGSMPLNMYANGGIANSPQVAIYGEGRHPEAYVPLPDGRSIPVTMKGGQQSQGGENISVNIQYFEGGKQSETSSGNVTEQAKAIAKAIKAGVMEGIINEKRQGGALYRYN